MSTSTNDGLEELRRGIARRHYRAGWCLLLLFLTIGAVLETLHGFKIGAYLDPERRIRREMWTLAHAHGTMLALVQIAFALGLPHFGRWTAPRLRLTSFFLIDAAVLMPLGFLLGGLGHGEGDPGLGVLLVPVGAILLFVAVACVVVSVRRE